MADCIVEREANYFGQDPGGRLFVYRDGFYTSGGEEFIRQRVKAILLQWGRPGEWSSYQAKEVVEYIRVDSLELWEQPPANVINLTNELLSVETRELKEHSPKFLSSIRIPVSYDPDAICPVIDAFIAQIFPEDGTDIAYEIPGVSMVPGEGQNKAILFEGSGGNGKSTFLAMLRSFVGKKNTSTVSLHRLESERFSVSRLVGKLANICPDLPSEHLAGTSVFKAITGKDALVGEYKFKDSFDYEPFARLIFSANNPPKSGDPSQGFYDRWVVVSFTRNFRGADQEISRHELDASLSEPSELSGLLNKALDGLARFRANGHRYSLSESMKQAFDEFRQTTDPLAVWLDRSTIELPDTFVPKATLREAFNSAAKNDGHSSMTSTAFGIAVKKLRPGVSEAQRTVAEKREWVWVGLALKAGEEQLSHARGSRSSGNYLLGKRLQENGPSRRTASPTIAMVPTP